MRERDEPMRREGLQAQGTYKEVPRPSRRLALATRQKIPYIAPPFVRAGPQPVYPNELISMYRKMSSVEALLVQGKRSRTSKPSSLDKNLNLWPKPSGKKGLI